MNDASCRCRGPFDHWDDACGQALFRAAFTGHRYQVRLEPNNHCWQITELTERIR